MEGFLTGTNYAISFILLQVFGLVLATKQPSATAATFAGIVRNNPGNASWSKISDFTARISRTQLAAAIGNVIAVCIGSVALERLWRVMFAEHYLPEESARHVYEALHPFASGTIIYAAGTGVHLMACGAHRRLVRKFRGLSPPDGSGLPTSVWPSRWAAPDGAPGGLD